MGGVRRQTALQLRCLGLQVIVLQPVATTHSLAVCCIVLWLKQRLCAAALQGQLPKVVGLFLVVCFGSECSALPGCQGFYHAQDLQSCVGQCMGPCKHAWHVDPSFAGCMDVAAIQSDLPIALDFNRCVKEATGLSVSLCLCLS